MLFVVGLAHHLQARYVLWSIGPPLRIHRPGAGPAQYAEAMCTPAHGHRHPGQEGLSGDEDGVLGGVDKPNARGRVVRPTAPPRRQGRGNAAGPLALRRGVALLTLGHILDALGHPTAAHCPRLQHTIHPQL